MIHGRQRQVRDATAARLPGADADPIRLHCTQHRPPLLLLLLLLMLLSFIARGAGAAAPGTPDWWRAIAPDYVGDWDLEMETGTEQAPPPNGPRGAPLAEGVIRLSKTLTSSDCRDHLNSTCFGRCLEALRVHQLGPLHNLTSLAEHPISPRWPPRSQDKVGQHAVHVSIRTHTPTPSTEPKPNQTAALPLPARLRAVPRGDRLRALVLPGPHGRLAAARPQHHHRRQRCR